jgi:hypothetical protein
MPASSQVLDPIQVTFDDERAVADAGLLLTGTLIGRLGLERLVDEKVTRGYRPGRKFCTVVSTLLAGGDCIDDVNLLHAGSTAKIVGHDTVAASTVGTWLRSLMFGHIRQLDAVTETALRRAWQAGAGPGDAAMFIDIDSTICEVHGDAKQGAAYGYTRQLGLHPVLATRADTGEILHARMRKGSAGSGRGAQRFVRETIGRVRRAGATGTLIFRMDAASGPARSSPRAPTTVPSSRSRCPATRSSGPRSMASTRTRGWTSPTPPVAPRRSPKRAGMAGG